MFLVLQVVAVLLVSAAMALALAHALEWPGKIRLSREEYLAVQPIYYPGFTIGGISEPLAVILTLLLVILTPTGSTPFWLTLAALVGLVAMHAAYWLLTHPVNNFWLEGFELKGMGAKFFSVGARDRADGAGAPPWTALRDRWETSHVIRAVLGVVSLILLTTAVAL